MSNMIILNVIFAAILGLFIGRLMGLTVRHLPEILFEGKEPRDIITRFLQQPLAFQYFEVAIALLFGISALFFPCDLPFFFVLLVNCILICCFITDYQHGILPDQLTLLLVWVGLIASLNPIFITPQEAIIGAVGGYGAFWVLNVIYRSLRGMEGMYPGDFKLNAGIGALFGIKLLIPMMGASLLLLFIVNVIHMLWSRKGSKEPFLYKEVPYACSATLVAIGVNYLMLVN